MSRYMLAIVSVVTALTLSVWIPTRLGVASATTDRRPLSDDCLSSLIGGQPYAVFCILVVGADFCDGTSSQCPGGTELCEGKMENNYCTFKTEKFNPESCQEAPTGALPCGAAESRNVLCKKLYDCLCEPDEGDDMLYCTKAVVKTINCIFIPTEVYCNWQACPQ